MNARRKSGNDQICFGNLLAGQFNEGIQFYSGLNFIYRNLDSENEKFENLAGTRYLIINTLPLLEPPL